MAQIPPKAQLPTYPTQDSRGDNNNQSTSFSTPQDSPKIQYHDSFVMPPDIVPLPPKSNKPLYLIIGLNIVTAFVLLYSSTAQGINSIFVISSFVGGICYLAFTIMDLRRENEKIVSFLLRHNREVHILNHWAHHLPDQVADLVLDYLESIGQEMEVEAREESPCLHGTIDDKNKLLSVLDTIYPELRCLEHPPESVSVRVVLQGGVKPPQDIGLSDKVREDSDNVGISASPLEDILNSHSIGDEEHQEQEELKVLPEAGEISRANSLCSS